MIKRVLAALVALVLAGVAAVFVVSYANSADARALEGMETDAIYVATEAIPEGTLVEDLLSLVELKAVPRQFQVEGSVTDLSELEGRVATAPVAAGEQLQAGRFATPDELRSRGDFAIPDEAKDYHQLTIPIENPRALGGSIAPGDRVGIFGSFEVETKHDYVLDEDGSIVFDERAAQQDSSAGSDSSGDASDEGGDSFPITELLLHKVLVIRVEGGYVAPPTAAEGSEDESHAAADTIHVTLALPAEEAARVIYTKEYGRLWFTLEPEGADDEDPRTIVITVPSEGRNVLE